MYAVLRQCSGENTSQLFDELEAQVEEVSNIMRDVPGFVNYTLFRTEGGGVSVSVCMG